MLSNVLGCSYCQRFARAKVASLIDVPTSMFQLSDKGRALFVAQHVLRAFFQLFALVGCEIDRRHDLPAFRLHQRKVDSNRRQLQIGIHAFGDPAGASAGSHGLRGVGLVIIDSYNLTQRQVQSLLMAWLKRLCRPICNLARSRVTGTQATKCSPPPSEKPPSQGSLAEWKHVLRVFPGRPGRLRNLGGRGAGRARRPPVQGSSRKS